ncbi:MAG: hypothetical protein K1X88_25700, partial [Nannocystaceae bacterium]|nr:hypothetical protein [Nannocystaceae bacterium]
MDRLSPAARAALEAFRDGLARDRTRVERSWNAIESRVRADDPDPLAGVDDPRTSDDDIAPPPVIVAEPSAPHRGTRVAVIAAAIAVAAAAIAVLSLASVSHEREGTAATPPAAAYEAVPAGEHAVDAATPPAPRSTGATAPSLAPAIV